MSEVLNVICPQSPLLNNITEINPENGLSILPAEDSDIMIQLKEIFEEMYDEINKPEIDLSASPEVIFSKYLWVIKMKEQEIKKVKVTSEKLIQDIEAWTDKKISQHQGQIDFLSKQMENYLRQNNQKSMGLPAGTIGLRKQQDKIQITDEDLFYQKADSVLLRCIPESYEPDMKKIKEHIKTTGEVPVGIEVTAQDKKFYYKLN